MGSFSLAHAQSPAVENISIERADSLFATGRYREAVKDYQKLPVSADVLRKIGVSYIKLWDMPAAISSLRKGRQLAPDDPGIEASLAEALSWDKKFDEAIKLYRDLSSRGSVSAEVRFGYARALAWNREYDAAVSEYRGILEKDSVYFPARMGLAQVLSWKKEFDEAIAEYTRAAALTADLNERSQALCRRAQVRSWKGEFESAVTGYNEALQLSSKNTDALYGLGEVHEWMEQYQKAKSYYEQILQIQPNHKAAKAKLLQLMWVK